MKAITLWQPWATLIAIGAKQYETRSWAPKYRGPLAIHAAKRLADPGEWGAPINHVLSRAGFGWYGENLPYGCVVCTVNLVDCYEATGALYRLGLISDDEKAFGDYSMDRFAWRLTNPQPVANIPARGGQGFWTWEPTP